ncbi:MAG: hypothetical protein ACM3U1_03780 [Chloroflexota bacterium]
MTHHEPYPEPRRRVRHVKTPGASTGSASGYLSANFIPQRSRGIVRRGNERGAFVLHSRAERRNDEIKWFYL